MSKLLKLLGKITTISLEWFLVVFILFAFLVRTSPVQTYLAQRATTYFSKELKTKVSVGNVSIVFFNKIVLDEVEILDQQGDNLTKFKSLYLTLAGINQIKNEIRFKKVKIEKGMFHLNQSKNSGKFNFDFIVDYFSSPSKSNNKYTIKINQLALQDVDLKYDDNRKIAKTDEIDYDHVHLKNFYMFANDFSFNNGTVKASVNHLSLKEKCGLIIKRFSGHVKVNDNIIQVKELRAKINRSNAYLPKFQMMFSSWNDFLHFDDKVYFNASLAESHVNIKDIQFFSSELDGMDQICEVKATVSQPLKKLKIDDLDLKFGESSLLRGNLVLPDFRNLKSLDYNEFFTYLYVTTKDIENFKFPKITGILPIEFNNQLDKFKFFEGRDVKVLGTNQLCKVYSSSLKTDIGIAKFPNGIQIKHNHKKDNYRFSSLDTISNLVRVDSVDFKKILEIKDFGKMSGDVTVDGDFDLRGGFAVNSIKGKINSCRLNNYNYSKIDLHDFSFKDDKINLDLTSNDPNALLSLKGEITMLDDYSFDFKSKIDKINLYQVHLSKNEDNVCSGELDFDISGLSLNSLRGQVNAKDFLYTQSGKQLHVKQFVADLKRYKHQDEFKVKSSILDLSLEGQFNFENLFNQFNNRLHDVFPTVFALNKKNSNSKVELDYNLRVNDSKSFFEIFYPSVSLSKGSKLKGKLTDDVLIINAESSKFSYKNLQLKDVSINSRIKNGLFESDFESQKFILNDSIKLSDLSFFSNGENNLLNSTIQWNSGEEESSISMDFSFVTKSRVEFKLQPSYFHLNKNRWDIFKPSEIIFDKNYLRFDDVEFKHADELVILDGILSNNSSEYANLIVSNFELANASMLLGLPKKVSGKFNADIQLSNPFSKLEASGDALINNLIVGKEKVGTIDLSGKWISENKSLKLNGNMIYRNNPTFNFSGYYYPFTSKNNMDFDLVFNGTDIQVVNAFVDEGLLNDIQGTLLGDMHLGGELFNPILEGEIDLKEGRTKVEMLGVYFGFEGKIISDKDGFYVNNMPVKDQEGKTGSLIATLYHSKYKNWNYDINIDFTEDLNSVPGLRIPINRYLLMSTTYKEGDVFYGKAYGKGTVNINGTENVVYINSSISSEDGTVMNFPMFGQASVQEDKFISFKSKEEVKKNEPKKYDYSGVEFNLDLKVNQSSMMKLIFDERLGDEIIAYGIGDVSIKMDQTGEVQMAGEYKIKNDGGQRSSYNFVMGPIKQSFTIEDNGTITWNGKPYVAFLDLTTYYNVYTSLNEILPVNATSGNQNFQEVKCNMKLSETIEKPKLNFQLELSKSGTGVNDDARAALSRINENSAELNKQFFSLLLYKKFQPLLSSNNTVGSNAVADLFANQLNSFLNDLSKGYKFNVSYNSSNQNFTNDPTQTATNINKIGIGVTKDFFDGKLLVNGSFGRSATANQSMLIGNVNIEYKLNDDGTIRVIAFNETNDFNVVAQLNSRTTQGGGINIQEEFSSINEFDLFQKLFNYFRTEDRKRLIKKRKNGRVPVIKSSKLSTDSEQAKN